VPEVECPVPSKWSEIPEEYLPEECKPSEVEGEKIVPKGCREKIYERLGCETCPLKGRECYGVMVRLIGGKVSWMREEAASLQVPF